MQMALLADFFGGVAWAYWQWGFIWWPGFILCYSFTFIINFQRFFLHVNYWSEVFAPIYLYLWHKGQKWALLCPPSPLRRMQSGWFKGIKFFFLLFYFVCLAFIFFLPFFPWLLFLDGSRRPRTVLQYRTWEKGKTLWSLRNTAQLWNDEERLN